MGAQQPKQITKINKYFADEGIIKTNKMVQVWNKCITAVYD